MTGARLSKFLKIYWRFVLFMFLVFGLAGFLLTLAEKPSFEASQTFFVKRQTTVENRQFYTYDGYYSSQAAERFADSLFGALSSRDVLRLALSENRAMAPRQLSAEINGVKIRRLSPQLVNFAYKSQNLKEATDVVAALSAFVSKLTGELSQGGDTGVTVSFISSSPLIITHSPSFIINTLVGALLGLFLSFLASAVIFYFKES
ncbi:MAG: hypothetical protein M1352_01275 [Patescibacteria group bacterium]|nr:hypothetical protein [Patescibacteria group bacterium]